MNISKDELATVLAQFNPWWRNERIPDLPGWHRAAWSELFEWVSAPPAARAVLLSGARQVGKTTLLLQVVDQLLKDGVPPANILYATFDHPILKMAGIDAVLSAWREREPQSAGLEYLFLDEAQFMRDAGTWIKHQTDFVKNRRIVFTGSAMPLIHSGQESGVGRWHTIKLATLSFYEYLQLNQVSSSGLPALPPLGSFRELFDWSPADFRKMSDLSSAYTGHFHEYLMRGGFPQTARIDSIQKAQQLLREDIIDKVLKRDMTALFGVRRVLELEQVFLYFCMHDGGLLDIPDLCGNLEVKRPTAMKYIDLLEATHLVYRLLPFGYGKDILRAKFKIYLADAAIASAVLLRGKSILDDPNALGIATETAVFKHLYTCHYSQEIRFTHWHGTKNHEVDLVATFNNQIIPFEVKYRTQHTGPHALKGLIEFCRTKSIKNGYVITKSPDDFGLLLNTGLPDTNIMKIPAPLLCYWVGESELSRTSVFV